MKYNRTSLVEELITAPWWVVVATCAIGNLVIWLIIPEYLEANISGSGIIGSMLTGGYAGAQPLIAKIFNLAMIIIFAFSLFYNLMIKERWSN